MSDLEDAQLVEVKPDIEDEDVVEVRPSIARVDVVCTSVPDQP